MLRNRGANFLNCLLDEVFLRMGVLADRNYADAETRIVEASGLQLFAYLLRYVHVLNSYKGVKGIFLQTAHFPKATFTILYPDLLYFAFQLKSPTFL